MTGCLRRIEKVNICMKLAKNDFLVIDENIGLCLYMSRIPKLNTLHYIIENIIGICIKHSPGWRDVWFFLLQSGLKDCLLQLTKQGFFKFQS